jgi:riboflavin transporter FmnP
MEKVLEYVGIAVLVLLLAVALATVSAWFVMVLVNYVFTIPIIFTVFGTAQLGFWKAWGLTVLASILFKSASFSTK